MIRSKTTLATGRKIQDAPFYPSHLLNYCRASFWRGGTSKGVFLNDRDLPDWVLPSGSHLSRDKVVWENQSDGLQRLLAPMMGSPDSYGRQLNGLGGGISSLSKAMIVRRSTTPDADVEYTFIQVGIKDGKLDMIGNCGNLSSVIGPFAINEGIVSPEPDQLEQNCINPVTVRLRNTNTNKLIDSTFNVIRHHDQWKFQSKGDHAIDGVAGKASPITLSFINPGGAKTGRMLPTGNLIDEISTSTDRVAASLVDITNPGIFVDGRDLGWDADRTPEQMNEEIAFLRRLEEIRRRGAEMMGMDPEKGAVPKIVLVFPPLSNDVNIRCQALSMEKAHKAVPGTLALNLGAACQIPGTIPNQLARGKNQPTVVIGHPSGHAEVGAQIVDGEVQSVSLVRTARCLMEGVVNTMCSDEAG